jgi:hypothetical protein
LAFALSHWPLPSLCSGAASAFRFVPPAGVDIVGE